MIMSDELILNCLKGKRGAEEALFKHCYAMLWNLCRLYSNDEQEAMSYMNLGFYKILKGLKKRKKEVPFDNWAKRVLINAIIDEKRKNNKFHFAELGDVHYIEHQRLTLDEVIFGDETCAYIMQSIKRLPETTATIFSLFAVNEFNYNEIAELMKIKEVTVRWHVSEARKKLSADLLVSKVSKHGKSG
jgi:RNA polymerase sigma factor (sigma-70 family)